MPLDLKIWSSLAEGHKGENEEVLDLMRAVDKATDGRGIRVYDRGGERPAFYDYQLDNARKFITRMNQRDLWSCPASERRLTREVHYSWQNRLHPCIIGVKPISVIQKS